MCIMCIEKTVKLCIVPRIDRDKISEQKAQKCLLSQLFNLTVLILLLGFKTSIYSAYMHLCISNIIQSKLLNHKPIGRLSFKVLDIILRWIVRVSPFIAL